MSMNAAKWARYQTWCRETSNATRQYRRAVERIAEVSRAALDAIRADHDAGNHDGARERMAAYRKALGEMQRDKWKSEKLLIRQIKSNINLDDPDGYVVVDGTIYAIVGTGSGGKILMIDIQKSKDIGVV
jgi:hypothetical protein